MKPPSLPFDSTAQRLLLVLILVLAGAADHAAAQGGDRTRRPLERAAAAAPILADFDRMLPGSAEDPTDPNAPMLRYAAAEQALRQGDRRRAMVGFGSLIRWAASDPYGDGRGAGALTAAAAWRLLRLAESAEPPLQPEESAAVEALLKALPQLRATPLISALLGPSPQGRGIRLEQDVLRLATLAAFRLGLGDAAQTLVIERLPNACLSALEPFEQELLAAALTAGKLTPARRDLVTAGCLRRHGRGSEASALLQNTAAGPDPEAALEAEFELAALETTKIRSMEDFAQVQQRLTAVADRSSDSALAQKALYRRAFLHLRQGPWQSRTRFQADLEELVRRHPNGALADDALYRLALDHEEAGESDRAQAAYQRLRDFTGPNDWLNLAHFKPALALIRRGGEERLRAAWDLLRALEARVPDGPLHPAACFWIGRIAEALGETAEAEAAFRRVSTESPFDYYGVRAALHLQLGAAAAAAERLPSALAESWRQRAQTHPPPTRLSAASPYHRRLQTAVDSGLYAHLIGAAHRLAATHSDRRLEQWPPEHLDAMGLFDALALLTAYRLDLDTAADLPATPENRLELAALIGNRAEDWAPALNLITGSDDSPAFRAAVQRDPRFPATAYPPVYRQQLTAAAAAHQVAWQLLYAVVRNESRFDPDALSPRQALGLFQFIPETFQRLDQRWGLLAQSRHATRNAYLRDPDASILLGARWFQEELLKRQAGQELLAIMEHNAGYPAVRRWKADWAKDDRLDDWEWMLETIPYNETRLFTKRVWTDRVIAAALFPDEPPAPDKAL